ncbi:MAG: hypothetical protein C4560_14520 [Nitrospiraceae bacterium]|nr:MAG: hypothetical protein C4560_14520 [Nitrospiraceae bacterium]
MLKKELELEERLGLLEREVKLLGDEAEKGKLDIEEGVDSLKIEIESLKMTLAELIPGFKDKFKRVKNVVLKEFDPEWMDRE